MSRCIQLAKKGLGSTYPNPLVGSVVVHGDKIIGEGWHTRAGGPHAEVNAINKVVDTSLLKETTLYVNLEPCSHFGRTPPCADLIISKGIKNVIIGSTDPNPKVSGKGVERLRASGCDVKVGVLEAECLELNKRFFMFHNKQRPYIFLKWAESSDGFIAPANRAEAGQPVWITDEDSRLWVHKMRSEEAAILVGTNTVLMDNPNLTTRLWEGNSPLRVVLDRNLRIPETAAIYDGSTPTLILSKKKGITRPGLNYETIYFDRPLGRQIADVLFKLEIQSLIVEGGTKMLQTFIEENLWDEAFVFKGDISFGDGTKAPGVSQEPISEIKLGGDRLYHFKNPDT